MRKCWCVLIVIFILLFSGCSKNKVLTNEDVLSYLHDQQVESEPLLLYTDPITVYTVDISDELIILMNISSWQECSPETITTQPHSMIYFDIPISSVEEFYRVAMLSNGYAIIQTYQGGDFADFLWYDCCYSEPSSYEQLENYVKYV